MMRKIEILLPISLFILVCSAGLLFAQETPPSQPAAPPSPSTPVSPVPPAMPSTPMARVFSFGAESGNFIGIVPAEITKENMSRYGLRELRGVAVARVIEGSPAERAGLKKDDVILRFDNEAVTTLRKLNRLIGESEPDHVARLGISRGGAEQEIAITLQRRSVAGNFSGMVAPGTLKGLNGRLKALGGSHPNFVFALGSSRRIGVSTERLTKQLGEFFGVSEGGGLLITTVTENSAASKAGLKAGDVITEVNGQQVGNTAELSRAINRQKEGEVTLTIVRHKGRRTIKLTPQDGKAFDFLPEGFMSPQVGEVFTPEIEIGPIPDVAFPDMPKVEGDIMQLLESDPIEVRM